MKGKAKGIIVVLAIYVAYLWIVYLINDGDMGAVVYCAIIGGVGVIIGIHMVLKD